MTHTLDLSTAVWRKSSYSGGGANDCVEVADGHVGLVPVRDSKAPCARPLVFAAASWSVFVERAKGEPGVNTIG
ncbi:DUF397 domain-containing protein [Streptomyces sp. SID12501]|uniref:DUF397 domain-containing protein n=1 Tax=Streptomyces sp. SID12501 TaxID=2706042 RepID=A0A6B3C2K3_9ACTN|nr:DUF397 domain-containing protein [Streptomyces sp. SID12501]NEC90963.1 DUF397 domain-containing protein [Streptomyces sp. SID12501]